MSGVLTMLVKAQRAARFVHLPQLGAIPALPFADLRGSAPLSAKGMPPAPARQDIHPLLEQEQLLGALFATLISRPGAKVAAGMAPPVSKTGSAAERQPDRAAIVVPPEARNPGTARAARAGRDADSQSSGGEVQRPLIAAFCDRDTGDKVEGQGRGLFSRWCGSTVT